MSDGRTEEGSWCGRPYNLTSNVPWGCRTCKDCLRRFDAAARAFERVAAGGDPTP